MIQDWQKTAFLFPGQGSQYVGMGKELAAAYPIAKETFQQADEILGFGLSKMCFEGSEEELNDTINTQPTIFVVSVAALRVIQDILGEAVHPTMAAGHSLGEFTALVAANSLTFEDGLKLVRERGRLMKEVGDKAPGAVAALLGMAVDSVLKLCDDAEKIINEVVVLANDNCPGQVVISGSNKAVDYALQLASGRGVKKAVKLAVSVAVHSPLMDEAAIEFEKVLNTIPIQKPEFPVIANVSTAPLRSIEAVKKELAAQIRASVRWTGSMQTMLNAGLDTFVEIGPGNVLTGLMKRINRKTTRINVEKPDEIKAFCEG